MPSTDINYNKPVEMWFGDLLLPITGDSFEIKNNNNNTSENLLDGQPYTEAHKDKAQTFSLSFFIPIYLELNPLPHLTFEQSEVTNAKVFTDFLWRQKQEKQEPFTFTLIWADGTSINQEMLLDDYSYSIDATKGSDYYFNITMTEYYPGYNTQEDEQLVNSLIQNGIRNPRRVE